MLELLMSAGSTGPKSPAGQMTWTTPGTYQWTVPDDVTTICMLVVGAGSNGYITGGQARGGNGGAVRWQNSYPVTPGSIITVIVGRPGDADSGNNDFPSNANATQLRSEILGLWVGAGQNSSTTATAGGAGAGSPPLFIGGGNGGSYDTSGGAAINRNGGGSSGRLVGNGFNGSDTVNRGRGINVFTGALQSSGADFTTGASAGGGGGAQTKAAAGIGSIFGGGQGAVRVIWGTNRWYPDKNIGNM